MSSQLPEPVYLEAKHQLHRGPTGQDAVIGMADEEEVQDAQEEHKGCGDPRVGGWRGQPRGLAAISRSKTAPTLKPILDGPSLQSGGHIPLHLPPGNSSLPSGALGQPKLQVRRQRAKGPGS